ncbi:MAG: PAS domain-containing protein, partial [Thermodesulfobacteriota bacterium]|nr:PAS domain-containing protein [Thermodesulfobacteriota bacterium]
MKNIAVTEAFDWRTRIFDTIPFPALILSTEKIIISANNAFLKKKNTDLDRVVGKTCHHVFYQMAIPCSAAICPFSKVIAEKKAHSTFRRMEPEGNEEVWVDRMFSPILDENGNVKFIMECVRDVTRMISLEKRSIHM